MTTKVLTGSLCRGSIFPAASWILHVGHVFLRRIACASLYLGRAAECFLWLSPLGTKTRTSTFPSLQLWGFVCARAHLVVYLSMWSSSVIAFDYLPLRRPKHLLSKSSVAEDASRWPCVIRASVCFPVDHRVRCTELQVVRLDLTDLNDVSVFFEMLCTANVCVAHFGPPCGTASRARERPLPPELAHIASPPLRSDSSPFGLDGLTASQAARVRSANLLYVVTLVSIWILSMRGSFLSCENPSSSLFWRVADLLAQDLPDPSAWSTLEDVHFHSCMWGSSRNKRTTFRATPGLCIGLAADCDGSHEHSSWTPSVTAQGVVFPTSGEAEYPRELASAYASFALVALQTKGLKA